MSRQQVTVLGATGSIGVSTLDVIARHPSRYQVFALTGYSRMSVLAAQCRAHRPQYAVVADEVQADVLQAELMAEGLQTEVLHGADALARVAADDAVDVVMAAPEESPPAMVCTELQFSYQHTELYQRYVHA